MKFKGRPPEASNYIHKHADLHTVEWVLLGVFTLVILASLAALAVIAAW